MYPPSEEHEGNWRTLNLAFVPVPYYCEENGWRLTLARDFDGWAVFVSNAGRSVALLEQKASDRPDGLVIWDYHVFAVSAGDGPALVWDFDTRLPFPSPLGAYLDASFPTRAGEAFLPRFRLVPGAAYAALLASDRSHMKDASGRYIAPPPPWPCPGEGRPNNLMRLVDMEDPFAGEVLGIGEMRERFGVPLSP